MILWRGEGDIRGGGEDNMRRGSLWVHFPSPPEGVILVGGNIGGVWGRERDNMRRGEG